MKPVKDLFLFLGLEILSVVWAAGIFQLVPWKVLAGGLAGGFFLLTGSYMLLRILRWPRWWEAWVLYPLSVYLFFVTIPMLFVRFTRVGTPFENIRIWGIPGPEFHHISSSVLGLLFLVTLAETASALLKKRTRASA